MSATDGETTITAGPRLTLAGGVTVQTIETSLEPIDGAAPRPERRIAVTVSDQPLDAAAALELATHLQRFATTAKAGLWGRS